MKLPPRILIMPGDTRWNLGDIAICLATIEMLRKFVPDCRIAVWGRRPCLGRGFEGVRFFERAGIATWHAAATADLLVWGGGQLLQGNRSLVKIPYWVARIALLRLMRKRIIGFGQGLGPFPRRVDRMLARIAVACTDVFTVRDRASLRTLQDIGVKSARVHLTADPALALVVPSRATAPRRRATAVGRVVPVLSGSAADALAHTVAPVPAGTCVAKDPVRLRLGLSLRYTRHHRQNRLVPFQFLPAWVRRRILDTADFRGYVGRMAAVCDRLVERLDADLVLVPMYYAPWETDLPLARALAARMQHRARVSIVKAEDDITEIVRTLDTLDAFIGTPMHSTILATSRHVPTLALHYEPKGMEYLALFDLDAWAFPLERFWRTGGPEHLEERILELWERRDQIRRTLRRRLPDLRRQAFANARHLQDVLRG